MTVDTTLHTDIISFIERWAASGAAERANHQIFLTELCDVLKVPRPEPTKINEDDNAYVFEKAVTFHHGDGTSSTGRIDLYKRGCFVLEAKQGSDQNNQPQPGLTTRTRRTRRGTAVRGTQGWNEAMMAARGQAEQYVRALPASEGRPPFLIVVDVGHSIALYSEFSRTVGNGYVEALRRTYDSVPESSDYVMYWWERAAQLVREGGARRFGLIATNSLRQTFNRRVVERHLSEEKSLSHIFAIPDHPWSDTLKRA